MTLIIDKEYIPPKIIKSKISISYLIRKNKVTMVMIIPIIIKVTILLFFVNILITLFLYIIFVSLYHFSSDNINKMLV